MSLKCVQMQQITQTTGQVHCANCQLCLWMLIGAIRAEVACLLSYSLHCLTLRRSSAVPYLELRACSLETRKLHLLLSYEAQVTISRRKSPSFADLLYHDVFMLERCVSNSRPYSLYADECIFLCVYEPCVKRRQVQLNCMGPSCMLCLKQHAGQIMRFCVFTHKHQQQGCMKSSKAL